MAGRDAWEKAAVVRIFTVRRLQKANNAYQLKP